MFHHFPLLRDGYSPAATATFLGPPGYPRGAYPPGYPGPLSMHMSVHEAPLLVAQPDPRYGSFHGPPRQLFYPAEATSLEAIRLYRAEARRGSGHSSQGEQGLETPRLSPVSGALPKEEAQQSPSTNATATATGPGGAGGTPELEEVPQLLLQLKTSLVAEWSPVDAAVASTPPRRKRCPGGGGTARKRQRLRGSSKHAQEPGDVPVAWSPRSRDMSPALRDRVATEDGDFLDAVGFGTWTVRLNPSEPTDRQLMNELLNRLYNRSQDGYYIHEVFGNRHGQNSSCMCDSFFRQLLVLAKHGIVAFATEKTDLPGQFDVCYDSPTLYNNVPGYFTSEFRQHTRMNGTGGGRKVRKGAPMDFIEGVDYFKSRTRAIAACMAKKKAAAAASKKKKMEQEEAAAAAATAKVLEEFEL
uniref:Uncharacterized protein n=1 Tax=Rhizochromulina marina TaxID=1034831 RepID=A0A7S2S0P6_9STRA|mmetsp:Transcript_23517/g.68743  ORF Transcript_23517/g.68743 Transcript_23517/m.68743 type:complete len:414 (+) Transcript_23517:474-1715(+)